MNADRAVRKDAVYYVQANWSDRPVLHLTGKRYVDRNYPVMDVRAYSNAATARLSVNGRGLGEVACPGRICVWLRVLLRRGTNDVAVSATIAGRRLVDRAMWIAPDPNAGLSIDAGAVVGGIHEGRRYGSDAFFAGGEAATRGVPQTSVRRSDFTYTLPLPEGSWRIAATVSGAGTIRSNGETVATSMAVAGSRSELTFKTTTRGTLALDFNLPDGLITLVAEPEK